MAEKENGEKKIIVDDDWKVQAQKEKEKLAEQEKAEREGKESAGPGPQLPPAEFPSLISMLATQAFFALGLVRTKEDDKDPAVDLPMAKFNIDMLEVIEEKTKGNLDKEEAEMLEKTLHQLRMTYVKLSEQG